MRQTSIIAFSVLAIAVLAAAVALWLPSGAQAGPTAQTPLDPPKIIDLFFVGNAPSPAYVTGDDIRITVKFSEPVTVTGTPQINLDVGGLKQKATYFRGSGTRNLRFAYTVEDQDYTRTGVSVPAGSLLTANATIVTVADATPVRLTHIAIPADSNRRVQGVPDREPYFADGASIAAQDYTRNTAITAWTLPAAKGGNGVRTYSLSPALPAGLAFDDDTRTISGTPTVTQNATAATYTYTVTDADGDPKSLTFTIKVDGTPEFPGYSGTLPSWTYAKGTPINWAMPAAEHGNTPVTYSLTPAPPAGLAFNAATQTLAGAATTPQSAKDYTYTATDADGDTATLTFNIAVAGPPTFGDATVAAQSYTRNVAIDDLELPAADGGKAPLTYSLTTPPAGLTFDAATRTLSGTPSAQQTSKSYTLTATDADGDIATLSFNIAVLVDYDTNDNGLIEVDSLAKLDAIRWDLDGNGAVDSGTSVADTAKYNAAYPNAADSMGCQFVDHDNDAATDKIRVCTGYELTKDLDFDTDDDGATYTVSSMGVVTGDSGDAYYNGGKGWVPLGTYSRFTATFNGNAKTISNLFIKDAARSNVGLFKYVGTGGRIERLGVRGLNVAGNSYVGGLAGQNSGTVSGSYAIGSVTGNIRLGGLVGYSTGTISNSYSTSSVTGNASVGGLVGYSTGTISGSHATSSVTSNFSGSSGLGGLVGTNYLGTISNSYATGSVIGNYAVGGLAGINYGALSSSYANVSVSGTSDVGGLVGQNTSGISTSYATGSVIGNRNVGGLVGTDSAQWTLSRGTTTNSYWDIGTTSQTASAGGVGKTSRELQSLTNSTGIYAGWQSTVWDFGTNRQYPVLKYGGLDPAQQRPPLSVHHDNLDAPVVGEPVTATLTESGATGITWQWQSSADAATWTNITSATSDTYIPVAADAAGGGKHLRVTATFTASGSSQTLTADQTAKVVSAPGATASGATSSIPIVGAPIRHSLSAAGATNPYVWRWQRCDDAAMTTNCKFRSSSEPDDNAYTEYTPVAGTDTDVGKYLQAYVYYTDTANSNAWTRTQTPVLGPVVASAPAVTTTP